MAVATGVGVPTRWWEWTSILTEAQLSWLPVDYELCDVDGVRCRAVGDIAAPPAGWIRWDTEHPYVPRLPASVI
jgi:hypothetical protein